MNIAVPSSSPQEIPVFSQLHVRLPHALVDEVSGLLFEFGAAGVEERDQTTFDKAPSGDCVLLVGSFDNKQDALAAMDALAQEHEEIKADYVELVGDSWRDEWKRFFDPFRLTPTIVVRPPWRPTPPWAHESIVLELEPGRAFGTGLHTTTSLIANYLSEHQSELRNQSVLDAGTGSGILSFVALAHGAKMATAFDNDPDVIDVVSENAERNNLHGRLRAFAGTVQDISDEYSFVVANIETRVLHPIADELASRVARGGTLLLSGVLAHEHATLLARYRSAATPLTHICSRFQGEGDNRWTMIVLGRPS